MYSQLVVIELKLFVKDLFDANNQVQNVKPNSKELTYDSPEPDTLVA